MRSLIATSLLLIPTLAFAGWGSVRGDGKLKTESRDVRGFSRIEIGVPIDMTLKQGEFAVKLTVDGNLAPLIETKVEGSTLSISSEKELDANSKARLEISLPNLEQLDIQGSSDVQARGFTEANAFRVEINGSGDFDYQGSPSKLTVDINGSGDVRSRLGRELAQVEIEVNGSGAVTLEGARTQRLAIEISGSGAVDTRKLPAVNGAFSVSGSGDIQTRLDGGDARFEVDGSGEIAWSGKANVRAKIIEGSGTVRQAGE